MSRCIGNVDDAELLQQMTTVVLQRVPSGGELFAQGTLELLWRDAVAGARDREAARRRAADARSDSALDPLREL